MSLLTTATATNRIVDVALHVTYTRRRVYGSWTYVGLNMTQTHAHAWEYVRTAQKTYRYVGLTEAAAKTIAATLNTYYTRATKVSEWDAEHDEFVHVNAGDVPMADIVPQLEEGNMWTVSVSVNETDTRTSLSASESFAVLFASEALRGYDEEVS